MINNTPANYFERAKAIQKMILSAQEDLKQLRTEATEELITEGTAAKDAKEVRADLAEVFYLARLEAKSELPKSVAKIARRIRMAEECGVQLSFMNELQETVSLVAMDKHGVLQ